MPQAGANLRGFQKEITAIPQSPNAAVLQKHSAIGLPAMAEDVALSYK